MTGRHQGRTTECSRDEARGRLTQARAFLEVAEPLLDEEPTHAHVAAALAVLAGIAAADATCGIVLGRWHRGQDHATAVDLLSNVHLRDPTVLNKFKRLLSEKNAAQYSPNLVTREKAKTMMRQAAALVAEAESH